jgi:hypothetical protein
MLVGRECERIHQQGDFGVGSGFHGGGYARLEAARIRPAGRRGL